MGFGDPQGSLPISGVLKGYLEFFLWGDRFFGEKNQSLEHSPTSQAPGEVGKDGKVGKKVRGVECGVVMAGDSRSC